MVHDIVLCFTPDSSPLGMFGSYVDSTNDMWGLSAIEVCEIRRERDWTTSTAIERRRWCWIIKRKRYSVIFLLLLCFFIEWHISCPQEISEFSEMNEFIGEVIVLCDIPPSHVPRSGDRSAVCNTERIQGNPWEVHNIWKLSKTTSPSHRGSLKTHSHCPESTSPT